MLRVAALLLAAGGLWPEVARSASTYEVRITQKRAGESLDGTVSGDDRTWSFHVRDRGGREIEVRSGAEPVARLAVDASGAAADVRLGTTAWGTQDTVPPAAAHAATDLATAIAIRDAAIKLADLAPGPEYKQMRLTALELYAEVARVVPESRPHGALGRPLRSDRAAPRANEAICKSYTQDALFDCVDDEGHDVAVVPFIDDELIDREHHANPHTRHHEPDDCYGACGASCGGKCTEVPVGCLSTAATPGGGVLCYAPHPEPGKQYRPSDDFDTSLELCPPGARIVGKVTVCTAAQCCFQHDECNRHDLHQSLGAYLKCQMWGLRECGFSAVFGVPKVPWRLKWFRTVGGLPVDLIEGPDVAGRCDGGVFTPPEIVDHSKEQAVCPIHGVKH